MLMNDDHNNDNENGKHKADIWKDLWENIQEFDDQLDDFDIHSNVTDITVYREWMKIPEDLRMRILNNGYCASCHDVSSFAPNYAVRKDKYGMVLVGDCSKCGKRMVRQWP